MLDAKKLLSKILNKLVVTTPSISISTSTGTLVSSQVRRCGNIVQLYIQVRNNSSVASGGNVFVGTINTVELRPLLPISSGSYYGAHAITGILSSTGSITIRNASSSAVSITGTNVENIAFTYIVGG